jgi:hypothetical protein
MKSDPRRSPDGRELPDARHDIRGRHGERVVGHAFGVADRRVDVREQDRSLAGQAARRRFAREQVRELGETAARVSALSGTTWIVNATAKFVGATTTTCAVVGR